MTNIIQDILDKIFNRGSSSQALRHKKRNTRKGGRLPGRSIRRY